MRTGLLKQTTVAMGLCHEHLDLELVMLVDLQMIVYSSLSIQTSNKDTHALELT